MSVGLGVLTEDEAQRCLHHAQEDLEATVGTPREGRLVWLGRQDREALVRYLLDPDRELIEAVFGDLEVARGDLTLAEYKEQIFWSEREKVVAASTLRREKQVWDRIETTHLGSTRMRRLDARGFERYLEGLAEQGLSGRTRAIHRATYKALMDYAERKGDIAGVHRFFMIRGSTQRTRPQEEPLTIDEVAALLAASKPMRRCMWAVGIGQGLRPSELVRVCWEDVDLEYRVLRVRGTKTEESAATIPLTPLAHGELTRFRAACGAPSAGPVFTWNGEPIKSFKRALAASAKKAEIEKRVTPYLLRHSFATLAWTLGVERDTARRVLRHSDFKMLDQVYCRPRPQDLVEKVARFALPV